MRKRIAFVICVVAAGQASADGVPSVATEVPAFSWAGYYFGAHLGTGLNRTDISDPYGPSIYGDKVRAPNPMIGLQGGYNWQGPASPWVFGAEADLSWLGGDGTGTCFAYSGEYISSNCTTHPDVAGSLAGRVGYATGLSGRTLVYGKVGGAFVHNDVDAYTNHTFDGLPYDSTGKDSTRWGWLLGAGVEQAISPAWSMKFEYDYIGLGSEDIATPASTSVTPGGVTTPVDGRVASVDQNQQMVKVGLNYRLGADPYSTTFGDGSAATVQRYALPPGWMFQPALRYWYSVGRFQKDLPDGGSVASSRLLSRLTYDDVSANSGEFYGRLDTPWRVFFKGIVGTGRTNGGHINDEDWALLDDDPSPDDDLIAYSNTISGLAGKNMRYASVDAGYDVLRGPDYRAGLFLGWAHVYEKYPDTGCNQIASSSPESSCYQGNIDVVPAVTETDTWDSLRLGVAADIWLTSRLQLTADAAYLPRVWFDGRDDHTARQILIKQHGTGQGTQLELLLSYYLTEDFSLGVGGRYWAMWTTNGNDIFAGQEAERSDTYRYERAGVFLQGAYTFDFCCSTTAALK